MITGTDSPVKMRQNGILVIGPVISASSYTCQSWLDHIIFSKMNSRLCVSNIWPAIVVEWSEIGQTFWGQARILITKPAE
jgi:hypothetical protein